MITKEDLDNRDGGPQVSGTRRRDAPPDVPVAERLALLEQRIVQAQTLKPSAKDLHCADCFHRGRDAVLRLLAG
jgi:hypothetical protein